MNYLDFKIRPAWSRFFQPVKKQRCEKKMTKVVHPCMHLQIKTRVKKRVDAT